MERTDHATNGLARSSQLLITNKSDEQLNYIIEHENSASVNDPQYSSKKTDKKISLNRKSTVMTNDKVKEQNTIKAAIEDMERKLSPVKESHITGQ